MKYFENTVTSKTRVKNMRQRFEKSMKIRKYKNIVEALAPSKYLRKFIGITILDMENTDNGVVSKFSWFGFTFFVIWYSLYYYCTYIAHIEDQSIMRYMHDTTIQLYGDLCERILSLAYVMLAMWKIPFSLSANGIIIKIVIDVDNALENLGEKVDYNKNAYSAAAIAIGQVVIYVVRLLSIWLTLRECNVVLPAERMYQDTFSDSLTLIVTAFYCYFLIVLRGRFRYVNKVLLEIRTGKSWEYKLFVRGNMTSNAQKACIIEDRHLSEKLRNCAKIYGMLYKMVGAINDVFGLILVLTMLVNLIYIILYLFYFLGATAAGLYRDIPTYINFSIYVFWQSACAVGILYLIVYYCESVMREAKETSFILHEIISSNLSPSVTAEAMQMSLQLLHQRPIFSAYGLYKLNYTLFEQGARSVSTYLVILLQFVSDANLW